MRSLAAPDGDCEGGTRIAFDKDTTVELVTCTIGHTDADGNPVGDEPSDELRITERAAYALVRRERAIIAKGVVGRWTDGWEWGGELTIAGVVRAPTANLLATIAATSNTDVHTETVRLFRQSGAKLAEVYALTADRVRVAIAHGTMTVTICHEDAPGQCADGAGEVTRRVVRWDGTRLDVHD